MKFNPIHLNSIVFQKKYFIRTTFFLVVLV